MSSAAYKVCTALNGGRLLRLSRAMPAEPLVSRPDDDERLFCPGVALLVRVHSEREHLELCTYLLGRVG